MIRVVAKFQLKPGNADKAVETARELVEKTRAEAGCVQYDLAQSSQDENLLVMLEAWETQQALDDHGKTEHFTRLVPQMAALCEVPTVVDTFTQVI